MVEAAPLSQQCNLLLHSATSLAILGPTKLPAILSNETSFAAPLCTSLAVKPSDTVPKYVVLPLEIDLHHCRDCHVIVVC